MSEALSLLTSRYQQSRPGSLVSGAAAVSIAPWSLAASGVSEWRPTSIAGCVLWLKADRGIHTGTGVSQWDDQSGSGDPNKNVAQATSSAQPTRNASDAAYNNRSTLSFASASSQVLTSGVWVSALAQPFTSFVVGNDDGTASTQVYLDARTGASEAAIYSAPGYSMYAGTPLPSGVGASSSPRVLCGVFNGASSSIFVSAQTASASGNPGTNGLVGMNVGANNTPGVFLNGKIAEVIVFSGVLSSTDRNTVFTKLGAFYNVTIGP